MNPSDGLEPTGEKGDEKMEKIRINQTYEIFIEMFGHLPKDDIDMKIWKMIYLKVAE